MGIDRRIFKLLLIGFVSFSSSGWAGGGPIDSMELELETRIRMLVHVYDPLAMVSVSLKETTTEAALPGTPLIIRDLHISDRNGVRTFDRAEARIWLKRKDFPPSLKSLVESTLARVAAHAIVSVQSMPTEWEASRSPASVSETTVATSEREEKSQWPLIGLGTLLMLVVVINGILQRAQNKSLFTRLEGEVKKAVETWTDPDAGGARAGTSTHEKHQITSGPIPFEIGAFDSLSEEGALALMMDTYWSECDGYAAYFWTRLSPERKRSILRLKPVLEEFTLGYLPTVTPEDLGFASDPSYLMPLPIDHLNQAALGAAVRQRPALLKRLSRCRRSSLDLSAVEQLRLMRDLPNGSLQEAKSGEFLKSIAPSSFRQIRKSLALVIRSVEDESTLLEVEGLTLDQKEGIPSLAFLLDLQSESLERLLKGVSARDLATAWVGPAHVLSGLSAAMPTKKRELLEEYSKSIQPSRDSAVFRRLHAHAIAELREAA